MEEVKKVVNIIILVGIIILVLVNYNLRLDIKEYKAEIERLSASLKTSEDNNVLLSDTIAKNKVFYEDRIKEANKLLLNERELCNKSIDSFKERHEVLLDLLSSYENNSNTNAVNTDNKENKGSSNESTKFNTTQQKYQQIYNNSISYWNSSISDKRVSEKQ